MNEHPGLNRGDAERVGHLDCRIALTTRRYIQLVERMRRNGSAWSPEQAALAARCDRAAASIQRLTAERDRIAAKAVR